MQSLSVMFRTLLSVMLMICLLPSGAWAKGLIRDTEIEHTLRAYSDPIFETVGLDPSNIHIYIVDDDSINAFVMGGSNIFIHTGLIMRCPKPGMLIGAVAHETGHIAGGHLVRTAAAMEQAQMEALMGYLLGAAAIASGASDVGAAVMSAGQNTATRGLFSYTRANEQAADQSALDTMDKLKISASGLEELFEVLRKQENRQFGEVDPYTRTHPLGSDRITHVRNHVEQSSLPADSVPAGFFQLHERMLGKLEGFLQPIASVLAKYPASDTSVRALYARGVAYFRSGEREKAVGEMDQLLASSPQDPYFHELKGQILFENGKIKDAEKEYTIAASLLSEAPLIRTDLARVLLATEDAAHAQAAIPHLEYATSADPDNPPAWRLLATAYGRTNRMDLSHLALAEEAIHLNKADDALAQLNAAKPFIQAGSPAEIRANDIRADAEKRKKNTEDMKK